MILQLGQAVLWQKAHPVAMDEDVSQCVMDLKTHLQGSGGIGIAAPQIGVSKQICIVHIHPTKLRPHLPHQPMRIMINPCIAHVTAQTETDWEACLSVSTSEGLLFGQVARSVEVHITYENELRAQVSEILTGFAARVFLHEYDHLQGMLFIERMSSIRDLITQADYLLHMHI